MIVDEVGSNISQLRDRNIGSQKYFNHFGFTAATGEPIMGAIIFANKVMMEECRLGFDPSVTCIGQDEDVKLTLERA
jgi:hypothetical protein